jgi:hypothetical protein
MFAARASRSGTTWARLSGTAAAGFLELIEEPVGASAAKRFQAVPLPFFDREMNVQTFLLQGVCLALDRVRPSELVKLSDVHIDAELGNCP